MHSGGGGERGCLPQGQSTQQASKTLAMSSRWESRVSSGANLSFSGPCVSFALLPAEITANLAALSSTHYIILQLRRPEVDMGVTGLRSRCQGLRFFLEALRENPFPCLLQLREASHLHPLAPPLSSAATLWPSLHCGERFST